jgi:hypothetical protein
MAAKASEEKVSLRVAMTCEFYDELYEFLKQKGYVSLGSLLHKDRNHWSNSLCQLSWDSIRIIELACVASNDKG